MNYDKAKILLEERGLRIAVSDSGYNKRKPADCILAQAPDAGVRVKEGRVIYVTVNSNSSPTVVIPDIIDNCSLREAEAKLVGLGFKMLPPRRVDGEKDWVYGIKVRGKNVTNGSRVSVEDVLIIQVGDGMIDAADSVAFADPVYEEEDDMFEVVTEPTEDVPDDEPATTPKETPPASKEPAKPAQPAQPEVDDFEEVTGPEQ
jgi:beta-lactam-binding protein with PASTA domain